MVHSVLVCVTFRECIVIRDADSETVVAEPGAVAGSQLGQVGAVMTGEGAFGSVDFGWLGVEDSVWWCRGDI